MIPNICANKTFESYCIASSSVEHPYIDSQLLQMHWISFKDSDSSGLIGLNIWDYEIVEIG